MKCTSFWGHDWFEFNMNDEAPFKEYRVCRNCGEIQKANYLGSGSDPDWFSEGRVEDFKSLIAIYEEKQRKNKEYWAEQRHQRESQVHNATEYVRLIDDGEEE